MLLAIDTSTRAIGVALYDGARVLNEMTWISKNHHTIELAPAVDQALARVGANARDLCAIGVAIGPGSFTGLRIGLALAKGLALSHKLSLVGIPTLDVVAAALPVPPGSRLATVLEAGRRRLAIGWYHAQSGRWQPDGDLQNLTIEEFVEQITEPILVCGELSGEARERLSLTKSIMPPPVQCVRRPAVLAELAWKRWQAGQVDDPAALKPIYLHYGEPIPE
jgi:tRNA threonylcarbamoyladenosine biosynthesis protein TsaB